LVTESFDTLVLYPVVSLTPPERTVLRVLDPCRTFDLGYP
jgi:hypothetical protein